MREGKGFFFLHSDSNMKNSLGSLLASGRQKPEVGLSVNPNRRKGKLKFRMSRQLHSQSLAEASHVCLCDRRVSILSLPFCLLIDEWPICLICLVLGRKKNCGFTNTGKKQLPLSWKRNCIPCRVFLFQNRG